MPELDPQESAFDAFLDQLLQGAEIDAEEFIARHPSLSNEEASQVRRFCNGVTKADSAECGITNGAIETEASDLSPFERIGGFRLIKRIGSGGMGTVFLGEDEALGRLVAVKILSPDHAPGGDRGARFFREARAIAKLHHPHVVTLHNVGEEGGLRYLVMEYLPGRNLADAMAAAAADGGRIPAADVLRYGTEIAEALSAAHAAGIIHRDVKPSNIRLVDDGRAVLVDFGVAYDEGAATLTASGAFCGSPRYASPEQVDAKTAIDVRTDIYSLGATLYEALTNVAPFRGETRERLFRSILEHDPLPLRRLVPGLSRDLEAVILTALEKDPKRRHPTAAAFAADLIAVREGRQVSVRPVSVLGKAMRRARRQPVKAALMLALALALPALGWLGFRVLMDADKVRQAEATNRAERIDLLLTSAFADLGENGATEAKGSFAEVLRLDPTSHHAEAGFALCCFELRDYAELVAFLDERPWSKSPPMWAERLRRDALKI